jgi:hypothetical protein
MRFEGGMMERKTERVGVRLTKKELGLLQRQAKFNQISVTELIERFIDDENKRIVGELSKGKFGIEMDENGYFY